MILLRQCLQSAHVKPHDWFQYKTISLIAIILILSWCRHPLLMVNNFMFGMVCVPWPFPCLQECVTRFTVQPVSMLIILLFMRSNTCTTKSCLHRAIKFLLDYIICQVVVERSYNWSKLEGVHHSLNLFCPLVKLNHRNASCNFLYWSLFIKNVYLSEFYFAITAQLIM